MKKYGKSDLSEMAPPDSPQNETGASVTDESFDPDQDKYRGQGGSYILDPATGRRILVERTQPGNLVNSEQ